MDVTESFKISQLPPQVLDGLVELGERFRRKGVRLVLFGSFAKGTAHRRSDLDIAAFWENAPEHMRLWMELEEAVEDLPTVRPIDLVDIETASDGVADDARASGIPLINIAN